VTAGLLGRDVMVTIADGRRLRAMVAGDGDDLGVLEAGLGGSGLTWGPVHGILARPTASSRTTAPGSAAATRIPRPATSTG
jgi:hypothetical protein